MTLAFVQLGSEPVQVTPESRLPLHAGAVLACVANSDFFFRSMTTTTRSQRVTATVVLFAACLFFGATVGYMAVSLFSAEPSDDWYTVADRTGGIVVGGLVGSIAGGYLAPGLSVTARWWSALVAVVLAAGTLWSLAITA